MLVLGAGVYQVPLIRKASANLYSLIETAKANGIEPNAYLRTVFIELPNATSVEEIEALLPVPADHDSLANV